MGVFVGVPVGDEVNVADDEVVGEGRNVAVKGKEGVTVISGPGLPHAESSPIQKNRKAR